ncbi:MAG TPA: DUF2252 family protein, partial [Puia sp.]|nr:DUF2252 family protein [Puia sp.]
MIWEFKIPENRGKKISVTLYGKFLARNGINEVRKNNPCGQLPQDAGDSNHCIFSRGNYLFFCNFPQTYFGKKINYPALQPITERIKQFNSDRVPAYTAIKYQTMSQNAFRFFRGTCHLFYEDLGNANALAQYPVTWICGDLHLENFGSYKGDNRLVYFDLNDFDEALLAPATWELSRIVTSIFVGFEALGISPAETRQLSNLFLSTYSAMLAKGKSRYIEPQTAKGIVRIFLDRVRERKMKV